MPRGLKWNVIESGFCKRIVNRLSSQYSGSSYSSALSCVQRWIINLNPRPCFVLPFLFDGWVNHKFKSKTLFCFLPFISDSFDGCRINLNPRPCFSFQIHLMDYNPVSALTDVMRVLASTPADFAAFCLEVSHHFFVFCI